MHPVHGGIVALDREKSAGPDMQRHLMQRDAPLDQPRRERFGEMQSGGRRGNRTVDLREHRLVVGAVALVGGAARRDIGRQRHVAAFVHRLVEHGPVEREGKRDLAALALRLDRGIKLTEKAHPAFLAEAHDVARRQPLGRLDESAPARAVEALVQGCLDHWFAAAADAPAVKPRRNDLTVVDHQRVAGLQEIRQIAY